MEQDLNSLFEQAQQATQQQQTEQAIALYSSILKQSPNDYRTICELGLLLLKQENYSAAMERFKQAIAIKPDDAISEINLALALCKLMRFEESIPHCTRALAINPTLWQARVRRGLSYIRLVDFEKAVLDFEQLAKEQPQLVDVQVNLGLCYYNLKNFPAAQRHYLNALKLNPNSHEALINLGCFELLQGQYQLGFQHYQSRHALYPTYDQKLFPTQYLWRGEDLRNKKLVLIFEQGNGDNIQFIRFTKQLKALGAHITVFGNPALKSLFASIPYIDRYLDIIDDKTDLKLDYFCPLLDVATYLVKSEADLLKQTPYLFAPPALTEKYKQQLSNDRKIKIGVCWAGNPEHNKDQLRSVPVERFLQLQQQLGLKFYSLQVGPCANDINATAMHRFDEQLTNYAETAALISQLDLVITVDTSVLHLAGALGKPSCALIYFNNDWRWLIKRNDTPWYANMRLFRQQQLHDWDSAFNDLTQVVMPIVKNFKPAIKKEEQQALKRCIQLANQAIEAKDYQQALSCFAEASRLRPNEISFIENQASCLFHLGKYQQAITLHHDLIQSGRAKIKSYYDTALCYSTMARKMRQASKLSAEQASLFAKKKLHAYEQAVNFFDLCFKKEPNNYLAIAEKGIALTKLKRFEEAISCLNTAIEHNTEVALCRFMLGLLQLQHADYKNGWKNYEIRFQLIDLVSKKIQKQLQQWQGESISQKHLLIIFEQGAGDNLQCLRFIPMLKDQGATVTVFGNKALKQLVESTFPTVPYIDSVKAEQLKQFDYYAPFFQIAKQFIHCDKDIPNHCPYLSIDKTRKEKFTALLSSFSGKRIGVVWAGNPDHKEDANRSCSVDFFLQLQDKLGIRFISLQVGKNAADVCDQTMLRMDAHLKDYADTAALISCLDLVISVDTSVAHLAAALAVPTWILNAFSPDWRWQLNREDSPWYPSVKLYNQVEMGNWHEVFSRIESDLKNQ